MSGVTMRDNRRIEMNITNFGADPTPSVSITPSVTPSQVAYDEMTIKTLFGKATVTIRPPYDIGTHEKLYYKHRTHPSEMNRDALMAYEFKHGKSSYDVIKSFHHSEELQKYDKEHGTINTVKSENITLLHYLLEKFSVFEIEQTLKIRDIETSLWMMNNRTYWDSFIGSYTELKPILYPKIYREYSEDEFVKPIIV
jgi:hypothetical protein